MNRTVLYTDGGARGNPGPAGAAAVCYAGNPSAGSGQGKKVFELKKYLGDGKTNNWAEYEALVLGLTEAKKRGFSGKALEVRMDSELIVKQMQGEYQVKEETLWPQYMMAHNLLVAHFPDTVFVHVRREQNAEADALVNEALDEAQE